MKSILAPACLAILTMTVLSGCQKTEAPPPPATAQAPATTNPAELARAKDAEKSAELAHHQ